MQSELQTRLGRRVDLGDMHLKLFPLRLGVENLAISDDPRFNPDSPFVKAKELDVSVKLLPLFHEQIEIESLDLERPNVKLIKNQAGQWNFASIGQTQEVGSSAATQPIAARFNAPKSKPVQPHPAAESNTTPQTSSQTTQQQFSLGQLAIEDGQISLLDQTQSKTPSLYDHIDLTLKNFSPTKPFTLTATVHMAGTDAESLKLQGQGGPIAVWFFPEATGHVELNDFRHKSPSSAVDMLAFPLPRLSSKQLPADSCGSLACNRTLRCRLRFITLSGNHPRIHRTWSDQTTLCSSRHLRRRMARSMGRASIPSARRGVLGWKAWRTRLV